MENDAAAAVAVAAYEHAIGAGEPRQLAPLRLRAPRLSAAVTAAAWGVAGLLSTIVPDLVANREHVFLYFVLLMAGVLLLLLAVVAPDLQAAERAAGRLEGWLRAALFRPRGV